MNRSDGRAELMSPFYGRGRGRGGRRDVVCGAGLTPGGGRQRTSRMYQTPQVMAGGGGVTCYIPAAVSQINVTRDFLTYISWVRIRFCQAGEAAGYRSEEIGFDKSSFRADPTPARPAASHSLPRRDVP